jgi:signal transduction histidine kinase
MRMGQLVEALLQLSRISQVEMRREKVDLGALARGIAVDLQRRDPERKARFRIARSLMAWGDPWLLQIALENLLGNAWKFTSRRSQAQIEFGQTQQDERRVFFVRDNGCGFDMAEADKLFTAFRRLRAASGFDGHGVGLATVARIIQRHGGRVWAEAAPECGATFLFSLPAGAAPPASPAACPPRS